MSLWRRFVNNSTGSLRTLLRPPRIPSERRIPLWPLRGWIVAAALLAVVAAVTSMILLDASLISSAGGLPRWLRRIFEWITWFGTAGWFLLPMGAVLFLLALSPLERLPRFPRGVLAAIAVRLGFIFLAIGLPALLVSVTKRLIGRTRPHVLEIVDPFSYVPFGWKESYASLPSGHATNAFAAAIAIGALWPKARLPMWIFAVVIAISRVAVTAHYPSDVIAGAVIGTTGAILVRGWFAARRLGFAVGSDATIHSLPGPSWQRTKAVARRLMA